MTEPFTPADAAAVEAQLGRESRGVHGVGHRCPCGNPDVVTTQPRLPNGTLVRRWAREPFPVPAQLVQPSPPHGAVEDKPGDDPKPAADDAVQCPFVPSQTVRVVNLCPSKVYIMVCSYSEGAYWC